MANEILSTGKSLLSNGTSTGGGGTGDGKVKVDANGTADYLMNKLFSSNDSISITKIGDKLSITENNSYEKVISPATTFPIMNCNATLQCPTYIPGDANKQACVTKINFPSGQIENISFFGGQNSSNNKHLYVAFYASDTDDVRTATKFGEAIDITSTAYYFTLANPIKIINKKFYWIMILLTAESNGGDAVNGMTTNITGAGIGTWQQIAGVGFIDNPFAGSVHFNDEFNYTMNYTPALVFPYVQCGIVK